MVCISKSGFVKRAMDFMGMTDEGKMTKLRDQAAEEAADQIKKRREEIEKLKKDKQAHLEESGPERECKVDLDAIGNRKDRAAYIENVFFPTLFGVQAEGDNYDKKIAVAEKEIVKFGRILETLK